MISMRIHPHCFLLPLLLVSVTSFSADKPPASASPDPRYKLQLTPSERAEFLSEMRNMLASIQHILLGIGSSDRELIAEYARRSGNKMARATPAEVRAKLPQSFRDIGGPTHMMFEELAIHAETDEMDMLARQAGELMNQCMACHTTFRVH